MNIHLFIAMAFLALLGSAQAAPVGLRQELSHKLRTSQPHRKRSTKIKPNLHSLERRDEAEITAGAQSFETLAQLAKARFANIAVPADPKAQQDFALLKAWERTELERKRLKAKFEELADLEHVMKHGSPPVKFNNVVKWGAGLGLYSAIVGVVNTWFSYQNAMNLLHTFPAPPEPPSVVDGPAQWISSESGKTNVARPLQKRSLTFSKDSDEPTHRLERRGILAALGIGSIMGLAMTPSFSALFKQKKEAFGPDHNPSENVNANPGLSLSPYGGPMASPYAGVGVGSLPAGMGANGYTAAYSGTAMSQYISGPTDNGLTAVSPLSASTVPAYGTTSLSVSGQQPATGAGIPVATYPQTYSAASNLRKRNLPAGHTLEKRGKFWWGTVTLGMSIGAILPMAISSIQEKMDKKEMKNRTDGEKLNKMPWSENTYGAVGVPGGVAGGLATLPTSGSAAPSSNTGALGGSPSSPLNLYGDARMTGLPATAGLGGVDTIPSAGGFGAPGLIPLAQHGGVGPSPINGLSAATLPSVSPSVFNPAYPAAAPSLYKRSLPLASTSPQEERTKLVKRDGTNLAMLGALGLVAGYFQVMLNFPEDKQVLKDEKKKKELEVEQKREAQALQAKTGAGGMAAAGVGAGAGAAYGAANVMTGGYASTSSSTAGASYPATQYGSTYAPNSFSATSLTASPYTSYQPASPYVAPAYSSVPAVTAVPSANGFGNPSAVKLQKRSTKRLEKRFLSGGLFRSLDVGFAAFTISGLAANILVAQHERKLGVPLSTPNPNAKGAVPRGQEEWMALHGIPTAGPAAGPEAGPVAGPSYGGTLPMPASNMGFGGTIPSYPTTPMLVMPATLPTPGGGHNGAVSMPLSPMPNPNLSTSIAANPYVAATGPAKIFKRSLDGHRPRLEKRSPLLPGAAGAVFKVEEAVMPLFSKLATGASTTAMTTMTGLRTGAATLSRGTEHLMPSFLRNGNQYVRLGEIEDRTAPMGGSAMGFAQGGLGLSTMRSSQNVGGTAFGSAEKGLASTEKGLSETKPMSAQQSMTDISKKTPPHGKPTGYSAIAWMGGVGATVGLVSF